MEAWDWVHGVGLDAWKPGIGCMEWDWVITSVILTQSSVCWAKQCVDGD